MTTVPDVDVLCGDAKHEAGLDDFGDPWLLSHLERLVAALNAEARLSEEGAFGARANLVNALVNRLRTVDLLKRRPEILEERVEVAAVVVGLPRTGSTMLHRMLAAAPGMTGVKWFEAQNYAPFPGEMRGSPEARLETARAVLTYMLEKIPALMSIHPMSVDQPDEEVIILGQLFSSTMMEASYYVPGFSRWLSTQDPTPAYRDLHQILQVLQWSDPERKGARWVLKTPGHLMALPAVIETFPSATIVMTHRDPAEIVPSYCSMEETLYKLGSNAITPPMVADFWAPRLKALLDEFMSARRANPQTRFIDIRYTDLLKAPIRTGEHVLAAAGVAVTPAVREGMAEWIEANKREDRAAHAYSAEAFGLSATDIHGLFADYIEGFLR